MKLTTTSVDSGAVWTVKQQGRLLLQAQGLLLANNVLEVILPLPEADLRQQQAVEFLLKQLTADARTAEHSLRLLTWDHAPVIRAAQLTELGFRHAVTLQAWEAGPLPPAASEDTTVLRAHRRIAAVDDRTRQELLHLLSGCLTNSQDLAALPAPDSLSLLRSFQRLQDAYFHLLTRQGRAVAMAVWTDDRQRQLRTLEYLAVSAEHRRQGLARQLLQWVRSQPGPAGHAFSLVVYCDRDNEPARRLYQSSDFTPAETAKLWLHPAD